VFPLLVTLLGSEYNVVHSYAAIAIEKLLSVKVSVLLNTAEKQFLRV
jgi:hypothetical protein